MSLLFRRSFPLLLLAVAILSGCRPQEALNWKISATSPDDFDTWTEQTNRLLPVELRKELARAAVFIQGDSGISERHSKSTNLNNPFCRRIDRKTIRHVLLDGYFVEKKFLANRVSLEMENILALEIRMDLHAVGSKENERFAKSVEYREQLIQTMKLRIAEIEVRAGSLNRQREASRLK
ncbi:MAG: hypothetical protein ABIZ81_07460 [Opitutaceae bacterium]